MTITTPNGTLHAVFVQDPDGFVVELLDAANGAGRSDNPDGGAGPVIAGSAFEATVRNVQLSSEPDQHSRHHRAVTLIELKNIERNELSGRTQDPGTTVVQLIVKDVTALTTRLRTAMVPIVTTGGEPVQVSPALEIAIVKDPNNMLLELVERIPARR